MEALLNFYLKDEKINISKGFYQTSFRDAASFEPSLPSNEPSNIIEDDNEEYFLGIDEAGRGPVLGPMVYTAFFYPKAKETEILAFVGLDDSKALRDDDRRSICDKLVRDGAAIKLGVGWYSRLLSPGNISSAMLRKNKYNLNDLSHDTVIDLVQRVCSSYKIKIGQMFVDTVGPPDSYQRKLKEHLGHLVPTITVSKKADSLFPCVSGASIVAKVSRDHVLEHWVCQEERFGGFQLKDRDFGSGYPGDPKTTTWLSENLDPLFGFPDIIRFSWSTCDKLIESKGTSVTWPPAPEDESNNNNNNNNRKRTFHQTKLSDNGSDPAFSFLKFVVQQL